MNFLNPSNRRNWFLFLSFAVLLGAFLRLSFPNDIEYKSDEAYSFEAIQKINATGNWPLLGMGSGQGVPNPGMSVWIFVILSKIVPISTPPDLARAVELLDILGLVILGLFAWRFLSEAEREPWCWATVLAAVNPFAVFFQRKIWAQSTLPFFCVLFWIAWHYRTKRLGAFFWGLLGVCFGQLHMSGFFFVTAVFVWTFLYDRRAQWGAWFAGSLIGAIPLIPWVQALLSNPGQGSRVFHPIMMIYPKYWIFWASDPLGLGLTYFIKTHSFLDFLRYPLVGGIPTYLVALAHLAIVVIAVLIFISLKKAGGLWGRVKGLAGTGLAVNSAFLSMGLLMTFACITVCRHYLIVTFPLEWVWLSKLSLQDPRWGRKRLMVLWVAQLGLTVSFLIYIHVNHGDVLGDYGIPYQFQTH